MPFIKFTSISAIILAMCTITTNVIADDDKYVTDGYGKAVKDGYKNCVKAINGNVSEGCAAAPTSPEPTKKIK